MGDKEPTAPSIATLKHLFALSGNRCAFPRCTVKIIQDGALVADVCHIKAARQNGPRYDPHQTPQERHGDKNLILLCKNHHAVIDDDVEAYTVERLERMKADHEQRSSRVREVEADHAAHLLNASVTTLNQSGGLAAHAVHAHTINFHATGHLAGSKRIEAAERLWNVVIRMRDAFNDLVFVDTILTPEELDQCFKTGNWRELFTSVTFYAHEDAVMRRFASIGVDEVERDRLFISEDAWSVFWYQRALYGRLAVLYQFSFRERAYKNWRSDSGFAQHVSALLGEAVWTKVQTDQVYGLQQLFGTIEAKLLRLLTIDK